MMNYARNQKSAMGEIEKRLQFSLRLESEQKLSAGQYVVAWQVGLPHLSGAAANELPKLDQKNVHSQKFS
jgi:hypothetical protein